MKNYLITVQYVVGMGLVVRANSKKEAEEAVENAMPGTTDGVSIDILTDSRADYPEINVIPESDPVSDFENSDPDYIVNEDGELEEVEK